jgi:hypothetical protein
MPCKERLNRCNSGPVIGHTAHRVGNNRFYALPDLNNNCEPLHLKAVEKVTFLVTSALFTSIETRVEAG